MIMAMDKYAIESNVDFKSYAGNVKKSRLTWINDKARTLDKLIRNQFQDMILKDDRAQEGMRDLKQVIDSTIEFRENNDIGLNDELMPGYDDAPSERTVEELQSSMCRMKDYNERGKYAERAQFGERLDEVSGYSDHENLKHVMEKVSEQLLTTSIKSFIQENQAYAKGEAEVPELEDERERANKMNYLEYAKEQLRYCGEFVGCSRDVFKEKLQDEFDDIDLEWASGQVKVDDMKAMTDEKSKQYLEDGRDFEDSIDDEPSVFDDNEQVQKLEQQVDGVRDARRLQVLHSIMELYGTRDNTGRWLSQPANEKNARDFMTETMIEIAGKEDFQKAADLIELPGYEQRDVKTNSTEFAQAVQNGGVKFSAEAENQKTGDFGE